MFKDPSLSLKLSSVFGIKARPKTSAGRVEDSTKDKNVNKNIS